MTDYADLPPFMRDAIDASRTAKLPQGQAPTGSGPCAPLPLMRFYLSPTRQRELEAMARITEQAVRQRYFRGEPFTIAVHAHMPAPDSYSDFSLVGEGHWTEVS